MRPRQTKLLEDVRDLLRLASDNLSDDQVPATWFLRGRDPPLGIACEGARKGPFTDFSVGAGAHENRALMESDRAQLSALASTLDDVTRRIAEIADTYRATSNEHVALTLDQVERSLNTAARQLTKTMSSMRR